MKRFSDERCRKSSLLVCAAMPNAGYKRKGMPKQANGKLVLYRNINGYFVMPARPCPGDWTVSIECFCGICSGHCHRCRAASWVSQDMERLRAKRPNKQRSALLAAYDAWTDAMNQCARQATTRAKRDTLDMFL